MRTTPLPPLAAAISFIDCINRCDLDGLVNLMTNDHRLHILDEPPLVGRDANREAWNGYMISFPQYIIYPERCAWNGATVGVLGRTTGSHLGLPDDQELAFPVIWSAEVIDGKLKSWSVLEDTPDARAHLGLAG